MAFNTGRSGDEPVHARSPLRLRLFLAAFGLACGIGGIVAFAVLHIPLLLGLFAALAAIATVNCAVIVRHIRAGEDYQPGPEVPPFRPAAAAPAAPRHARPEVSAARRHMRFAVAAIGSLVLLINAWAWIWRLSVPASVALTVAAGVLLLVGVVASNAGSPVLSGNAIPDIESRQGIPEADEEAMENSTGKTDQRHAPAGDATQAGSREESDAPHRKDR
jgi:hypothetical protein